MADGLLRVAVISTGGVGAIAVRAVHRRKDLDLVAVWVNGRRPRAGLAERRSRRDLSHRHRRGANAHLRTRHRRAWIGHGRRHGRHTMRVVNAIPYVVAAPAGVTTSLELPMTVPRDALG
jgi:hypothetical protein